MGFWGTLVLASTSGSLLDLSAIVGRCEGLLEEQRRGQWRLGVFPGGELASSGPALHRELLAQTGTPVLTAFVLDSETAVIEAVSPSRDYWRACLARAAMQGYHAGGEDSLEDLDTVFAPPGAAAEAAVAWAGDTGAGADRDVLQAIFAADRGTAFVEELFEALLEALGVPPAGTPDNTGVADAATDTAAAVHPDLPTARAGSGSRIKAAGARSPLDALIHDVAVPVLEPAGFRRRGRTFALTTSAGDVIEINFQIAAAHAPCELAFSVGVSLTPVAYLAWQDAGQRPGYPGRAVSVELVAPAPFGQGGPGNFHWVIEDSEHHAEVATALAACLRREAASVVDCFHAPERVMDALTDPRQHQVTAFYMPHLFVALGLGPTRHLDACLTRLEHKPSSEELMTWAARWLHDRYTVGDHWRDQVRTTMPGDVTDLTSRLIYQAVEPLLDEHGFTVHGALFTRTNQYGDRLMVAVRAAHSATPDDLRVSVEASVLLPMHWQWLQTPYSQQTVGRDAAVEDGWSHRRLAPTAEFVDQQSAWLGLDLWHITPAGLDTAARAMTETLTRDLPDWEQLLDRDYVLDIFCPEVIRGEGLAPTTRTPEEVERLRAVMASTEHLRTGGSGTLYNEIVARAGKDPPPQILALIEAVAEDEFTNDVYGPFLAWAKDHLTQPTVE